MRLWLIKFKNPANGATDRVITPHLASDWDALQWFYRQKPFMRKHYKDITITAYERGN